MLEAATRGLSDKQIALELEISVHTVDAHWRKMRQLFVAGNRGEVIATYLSVRHAQMVAELEAKRAELERQLSEHDKIMRQLEEANAELAKALDERDSLYVRLIDASHMEVERNLIERRRLRRLEEAVEASRALVYESEFGGSYQKLWVTKNLRLLGINPEGVIDGSVRLVDYMLSEDVLAVQGLARRAAETKATGAIIYYRLRIPDGTYAWFQDHLSFIYSTNGTLEGYFGSAVQVTALVHEDDVSRLHQGVLLYD